MAFFNAFQPPKFQRKIIHITVMKQVQLAGENYEKLAKAIFVKKDGTSPLEALTNWHEPLEFRPETVLLRQLKAGPCGLFAVIQAHIVLDQLRTGDKFDKDASLVKAILDIFERISRSYAFCTDIDTDRHVFTFLVTESRESAEQFMRDYKFLALYNACLLLSVSYIFTSCGGEGLATLPEAPYIEFDKQSTVALVWLLLNGSTSDESLASVEASSNQGGAQKDIGVKILIAPAPLTGTWLNPEAKIFVCLASSHFFAVHVADDGLILYDCMREDGLYIEPKLINWL